MQARTKTIFAFCLFQNLLRDITTGMANTSSIKCSGNSCGGLYFEARLWAAADKMRGHMDASESN
jgi:hypothetical protein